jgi:hypothetical protein
MLHRRSCVWENFYHDGEVCGLYQPQITWKYTRESTHAMPTSAVETDGRHRNRSIGEMPSAQDSTTNPLRTT